MKPQINNLKKFLFIPVLLIGFSAFSQTEPKNESKACTSKVELKEGSSCTGISVFNLNENKPNTPVLSKAIVSLNNKIEDVIFENKMVSGRNTVSISYIDRE
ncbi:MAG: hypothetical protein R2786_10160 [Flavobacteriaceae bacterium]